jgi:hypothetical protein
VGWRRWVEAVTWCRWWRSRSRSRILGDDGPLGLFGAVMVFSALAIAATFAGLPPCSKTTGRVSIRSKLYDAGEGLTQVLLG